MNANRGHIDTPYLNTQFEHKNRPQDSLTDKQICIHNK